jgi:hypothetical protein
VNERQALALKGTGDFTPVATRGEYTTSFQKVER